MNELLYLQIKTFLSPFSHDKVTTGSEWNLRHSATLIDLSELWWYKCLCGALALQGPVKYSDLLENHWITLVFTGLVTWFGRRGATHVSCLEQE